MAFISSIASLAGSFISADASRHAANQQSDASNKAIDTQWNMFQQNKQDLAPWMRSGQQGNQALMQALGLGGNSFDPNAQLVRPFGQQDFQTDPGYQFRLQQGLDSVLNSRSAMGGLNSGNTMKALEQYGQGFASNEYQNAFNRYQQNQQNVYNRLSGISNTGANAAAGIANLGANAAGNVSGLQYAQGQAQAGGTLGQAGAINSGIGNLTSNWLQANALQQQQGGGGYYMEGPQQNWLAQNSSWVPGIGP